MAAESKSRLGTYITTTATGEPVRAFIPPKLPPDPPVELAGLYQQLDRANRALGRLDGLTTLLPDTKFFLYLYIPPSNRFELYRVPRFQRGHSANTSGG